jgi:hypothetical protein
LALAVQHATPMLIQEDRMIKRLLRSLCIVYVALPVSQAYAVVITFEGFAPVGGLVNVNPSSPYSEAGFTLTPSNVQSAVFDSAAVLDFPGDATDFFGFGETNVIRLTGPVPFTLNSVLMGPTSVAVATISMTLVGNLSGGGTLTATIGGLSTATLATLNWTNLASVDFRATDDAALDNITVNQVPEPASLLLLGAGTIAARVRRSRSKRATGNTHESV